MQVSGQLHAPGRFTPVEGAPGTHWIGGWVGPKTGLGDVEKRDISHTCRQVNPSSPAFSPSLYRMNFPSSRKNRRVDKTV
jgi:hypothetical protein